MSNCVRMTIQQDSPDYASSFARGLSVLLAFGPDAPRMTLAEVARRTGLTRATARRFLLTLCALGFAREVDRQFELTSSVLRIGYAYLTSLDFWEGIQPRLQRVTETIQESCSAAVLDGHEIIYVARSAAPTRSISIHLGVGARLSAYATSMGQVLLADLPADKLAEFLATVRLDPITEHTITDVDALVRRLEEVRANGYAIVDQEREYGIRSLAVPLRDPSGHALAAVNVSTRIERSSIETMRENFLPVLRDAVRDCENTLKFRGDGRAVAMSSMPGRF